jgi:hypothetical protein
LLKTIREVYMKKTAVVVSLLIVSLLMLSCGTAGPAGPAGGVGFVMQFQNGVYPTAAYAGSADTGVDSYNPGSNYSGNTTFNIGYWLTWLESARYLVKYDLSTMVPNNAIVTKAYLTITVGAATGSNSFLVYQLGTAFVPANATWANSDTGTPWTTAGGDYGAAKSDGLVISAAGVYTFTLNSAMVQSWISNPSANYGIILKASNETTGSNHVNMSFDSAPTLANRPMLTVYYTLP